MIVAFDLETHLITPENPTPRLVCGGFRIGDDYAEVLLREQCLDFIEALLSSDEMVWTNARIAYDFSIVLNERPRLVDMIFRAYSQGRVHDCQLRQKLIDFEFNDRAHKSYSLAALVKRLYEVDLDKTTWRLGYADLDGVPLKEWPQGAIDYAQLDADYAYQLHVDQDATMCHNLCDSGRRAAWDWAVALMANRGLRTDKATVDAYRSQLEADLKADSELLLNEGLMRWGGTKKAPKLVKTTKAIRDRAEAAGATGRTATGAVSTAAEYLYQTDDPALHAVVRHVANTKLLSTYVTKLYAGVDTPIRGRFDTLKVTGRTGESGFNLQTMPRKGGVRECYKATEGYAYCMVDLDGAELRSLAQVLWWMFGTNSTMANLFRDDPDVDLHSRLAARTLGADLEWVLANKKTDPRASHARQNAKVGNFGFPGGMGPERLAASERSKYYKTQGGEGVLMSAEEAWKLREDYFATYPDVRWYLNASNQALGDRERCVHKTWGDERITWTTYCEHANRSFQALVGLCMLQALFDLEWQCWSDRVNGGPMGDVHPVLFVHDEIVAEVPLDRADECARLMTDIIIDACQKWIPDIPITATPALAFRLYKGAEAVYDEDGRLVPWAPKESAK